MQDGLYRVGFKTRLGTGFGVVTLRDGRISGGDSTSWYVGSYQLEDGLFRAEIQIDRHTEISMVRSVFGVERARILLEGQSLGNEALMKGISPDAPEVAFEAVLSRLA